MRSAISFVVWLLQVIIALGVIAPIRWPGIVLVKLGDWITQHVYYPTVRIRRRLAGEPLWKEIDLKIGIEPPPEIAAKLHAEWQDRIIKDLDAEYARMRAVDPNPAEPAAPDDGAPSPDVA